MTNFSHIRIVFMGSPDFAVPTLQALAAEYPIAGVVTQPDRPAGRGRKMQAPPVKVAAEELGLAVIQPPRLRAPEATQAVRDWHPDLIVVAAYGQILRPEVLDMPRFGCINVHASLLPRWRGASPIQHAILAGDSQTGITIMQMDPGMDTGPILRQQAIPIQPQDTAGSLSDKLSRLGGELLLKTLPDYLAGNIQPQAQDQSLATIAPLLKKSDGELDFSQPAALLARKVRAFQPWPGAFFYWQNNQVKVFNVSIAPGQNASPGERLIHQNMPAIQTSDGLLVLEQLQPAGKKRISGHQFLLGARKWHQIS